MERYFKKSSKSNVVINSSSQQNEETDRGEPNSNLKRSHEVANVDSSEHDPPSDPARRPAISHILQMSKIGFVDFTCNRPEYLGSGGGSNFVKKGFRCWKYKKGFDDHVGDCNSLHNQAARNCRDLLNQRQSIQIVIEKQATRSEINYRIQLTVSVDCVQFLARQGLAFRGHDESESSSSKGNFLELLRFLGDHNVKVDSVILRNAPQNMKLTSPDIQKEIVNAAAEEMTKEILAELGEELFSILIDESRDVSVKEQMAVVIRFVNRRGCVVKRFLGIVHIANTTSLSLKSALENLLGKHDLTISRLRGQGYDGASNMRGEFNGLKSLIMRENGPAYYIHCFAHQLQLCLVVVAKNHSRVALLFNLLLTTQNVVGASCKRRDRLREIQANKVAEAISSGEITTGRGLNQESTISRAGDTRWSSHFKSLSSLITLFSATVDVIEEVDEDGSSAERKGEASGLLDSLQSFDFALNCHLMRNVLSITHDLSQALQRKDQDIVSTMNLVKISKARLQKMRDSGWEPLFEEVCLFCKKHDIVVPRMEDIWLPCSKSKRRAVKVTNLHYYRVEMFYTVVDTQLQELNSRFTETTTELLICIACLNPNNSFSAFNSEKLIQLAQFYPADFNQWEFAVLESQLENYYMDLQSDREFLDLNGLADLAQKMVEKNKHIAYPLVYKLVKLALILPVATASVERIFSAMNLVKNRLRNTIGDQWLNDLLITYIEKELFDCVENERIIQRFQKMKTRRGILAPLTT